MFHFNFFIYSGMIDVEYAVNSDRDKIKIGDRVTNYCDHDKYLYKEAVVRRIQKHNIGRHGGFICELEFEDGHKKELDVEWLRKIEKKPEKPRTRIRWYRGGRLEETITSFERFNEALKISQYRKHIDSANWKFTEKMRSLFMKNFKDVSKNGYRAYFPLNIDPKEAEIHPPQEMDDWLRWYGFSYVDYRNGTCKDSDGRERRLGKVFQLYKRDDLLKLYASDPRRELRDTEFYVVLCCHPYDILGMSTGRRWTTCHDLEDQRYDKQFVGGLIGDLQDKIVAYLVAKDDKNVRNPYSRTLLEVEIRRDNKSASFDFYDGHIYGVNFQLFFEFLDENICYKSYTI